MDRNVLYYGDNLEVLRRHIAAEAVDLVYLDPPFNSSQDYHVVLADKKATRSASQVKAFADTWCWDRKAAEDWQETVAEAPASVAQALLAFRSFLGESDMLAYLGMMAPRLVQLRRILKPTGSLYLHCDPTASHYLKMLGDAVFGPQNFVNEIIWHYRKWPTGKSCYQRNHDVLFLYSKTPGRERTFHELYMDRAASTLKRFGTARIVSGYDAAGRRRPSRTEGQESPGVRQDDVWEIGRVPPIKQLFPTQKPEALLRRILECSSNEGDLVLDPFCGSGTTLVAAQEMKRRWIGMDASALALALARTRLRRLCGGEASYTVRAGPASLPHARSELVPGLTSLTAGNRVEARHSAHRDGRASRGRVVRVT